MASKNYSGCRKRKLKLAVVEKEKILLQKIPKLTGFWTGIYFKFLF